jgi:hypothetical protein
MALFLALLLVFPLVGLLTCSWISVLAPLVGWPCFYVGLHRGWWGDGTGDGWQVLLIALTVVGAATTVAGVAVGRSLIAVRGRGESES